MKRETARIYKVTCAEAYRMDEQGVGYSLNPWGSDTRYYTGYDDGGKTYTLPKGCHKGTGIDGELHIYDPQGDHCEIIAQNSGPAIVAGNGSIYQLQEVAE